MLDTPARVSTGHDLLLTRRLMVKTPSYARWLDRENAQPSRSDDPEITNCLRAGGRRPTHQCVSTMGAGLTRVDEHLDALASALGAYRAVGT